MRERLGPLLGPGSDGLAVGTFHAFCAKILRQEGEEINLNRNFVIYDDSDQISAIKTAMAEMNVDSKQFNPRSILAAISGAKSQLIDAESFGVAKGNYREEIVHRVYERYEQMLYQNTALDFDDLLFKVNTLFEQVPKVAEKYQDKYVHFMVDEFQDTNIAQYNIAKQISEQYRNICVVGDPDQSIYSWRNADIRNILSFQSDFPEAKIVTLEQNYRSTQTILSAAYNLITPNEQRVEKELWTKNGEGVPVIITEAYDDREEAQFVVRELDRLVEQDGYDRGDIAVMYRVNAQSRAFEEACMRYGIPYQLVGSLRFYQRQEIKDLIAYLRLIANPNDNVSFARVVNLPSRGIGQRTMYELSKLARELGMSMFEAIEEIPANDQLVQIQARSIQALTNFRRSG